MYNIKDGNEYEDKTVFTTSAAAYFDALTSNEKLRAVLAGTHLLYGGNREKTPLHVHALVVNSYIESSWRCVKGGDQLAKLLAKLIREAGGDVLRKKNVTRIELENDKAVYVETDGGERFYGAQFISNMHPAQTLDLTDTSLFRKAYRSRIQGIGNTVSAFIVNIVLKPDSILFHNRNYYYHSDTDVWNTVDYNPEEWPQHYALFENVPQKGSAYTDGIILMTYMRFDEVAQWENTVNTTLDEQSRGEDYERFKQEKAEELLALVYKRFPELEGAIQSCYTSTPLSYRDYIGTADGNMYGIAKDFNDPLQTTISPVTKIPNLFLTGANIVLHGVLGVTVGAFITTSCLLGKEYLVNKIRKANETLS
jgi:all-trans-retinol 13,14-reductase